MATLMQALAAIGDKGEWILDSQTGVTVQATEYWVAGEPARAYRAEMWAEHGTSEIASSSQLESVIRWLAINAPGITADTFTAWRILEVVEVDGVPAALLEPGDENVGIARGNLNSALASIKRRTRQKRGGA